MQICKYLKGLKFSVDFIKYINALQVFDELLANGIENMISCEITVIFNYQRDFE